MKKIAIILSGCGNRDGSELQETLSLLLALDRHNMQYQCFAPTQPFKVVAYADNRGETGEERNLLEEAARVCRGQIQELDTYRAADFDALALPGGMGAARNLSTYAFCGAAMQVLPSVENAILETYHAFKPVCAMCIAPIILAKVLGSFSVSLTLGHTCDASRVAEQLGAVHHKCEATQAIVDREHKIVTTPAYMVGTHISQIFDGAESLVKELETLL